MFGQKPLPIGFNHERVSVSVFVVRRSTTPEGDNRVIIIPTGPSDDPVQVESNILQF